MSVQQISLGTRGKVTVSEPFNSFNDFTKTYTVSSVRSLREMVNSGDAPFEKIYQPVGLTEDSFYKDLADDVVIYVLTSEEEAWVEVPSSYISVAPIQAGVEYRNRTVIINLGGLPTDEDLEKLKNDLKAVAEDSLGMVPAIEVVNSSDVFLVDYEKHDTYLAARESKITHKKSYFGLWKEEQQRSIALAAQVNLFSCALSKYDCNILKIPPNADNAIPLDFNYVTPTSFSGTEVAFLATACG